MTYVSVDRSRESAQPIELYRFSNGESVFTYCSGPNNVVFNQETYTPLAVTRTDPSLEAVTTARTLTVKLPVDEPFSRRYLSSVPASLDQFKLYRQHSTDGGTPETITFFSGQVTSVSFKNNLAEVQIQNVGAILDRLIPQQSCRNACNHILYDDKCGVIEANFSQDCTVAALSSDGLTVALNGGVNTIGGLELSAQVVADPLFFQGGLIERGAGQENRMVRGATDLTGNVVEFVVVFPFQTLVLGQPVKLYAGCDHQFPTCIAKFNNTARYGGFPFIPLKNPFSVGVKG